MQDRQNLDMVQNSTQASVLYFNFISRSIRFRCILKFDKHNLGQK